MNDVVGVMRRKPTAVFSADEEGAELLDWSARGSSSVRFREDNKSNNNNDDAVDASVGFTESADMFYPSSDGSVNLDPWIQRSLR